jgi:N-formylglutamate amidohydrolase
MDKPPALRKCSAIRRIEGLYKPYHRALRRLFTRVHRDFGAAVLID